MAFDTEQNIESVYIKL